LLSIFLRSNASTFDSCKSHLKISIVCSLEDVDRRGSYAY